LKTALEIAVSVLIVLVELTLVAAVVAPRWVARKLRGALAAPLAGVRRLRGRGARGVAQSSLGGAAR
jgi:hypothetical protein